MSLNLNSLKTEVSKEVLLQIAVMLSVLILTTVSSAQQLPVPMRARDVKSTVDVSSFEQLNLSSGSLGISLPIASFGGRGSANGFSVNIEPRWRRDLVTTGYSGGQPHLVERIELDPFALNGVFPQAGGYLAAYTRTVETQEIGQCSNETVVRASRKEFRMSFRGFGGQGFSFFSAVNDGEDVYFNSPQCWVNQSRTLGDVFVAVDGSGTKFISDSAVNIIDEASGEGGVHGANIYPSGFLRFPDGTAYRIDGGLVSWIRDRNGNLTMLTNTGFQNDIRENRVVRIQDALGREINVTADQNFTYVVYQGAGGAIRTIKVSSRTSGTSSQLLSSLFPWMSPSHPSNRVMPCGSQSYVELPDKRRYTFTFNCFGDLERLELPSGGKVEYDYELVAPGVYGAMERRLVARREFPDGSTLSGSVAYDYSSSVPTDAFSNIPLPSERVTTVRVKDSAGITRSFSKSHFFGCIQSGTDCRINPTASWSIPESAQKLLDGSLFRTEQYSADGATVMRQTDISHEPRTRAVWPGGGNAPYKDFRVVSVATTLSDSGQVGRTDYHYDPTAAFNRRTDTFEYDFGQGVPGGLLRRTHTDYLSDPAYSTGSVHLLSLPSETWISSDSPGLNLVARTVYEYDNYAAGGGAGLVDRPDITGHDTSFGTAFVTRGNVTAVTSYADAKNKTGAVTVRSMYDIAGSVVRIIDARGNSSSLDYSDNFGTPDAEARTSTTPSSLVGKQTYAFVTRAVDAVGHQSYSQFDYFTGAKVDTQDILGNVTSSFYNDLLDRVSQTISANNRTGLRRQTSVQYFDSERKVTVTSDSKLFGDNLIKSEVFYDGFGREVELRDYEGPTAFAVTQTEFDGLGRAYRTTNPFRPADAESAQWIVTEFDSLGRVTEVLSPDGGKVTRSYLGNTVRVTDQAGRSRSGTSDFLGRTVKVTEHHSEGDLDSLFVFDAAGRLRKSVQGQQNRFFMYDDLGRLKRSKQVEQQANPAIAVTDPVTGNQGWSAAFSYDAAGNMVSSTDARNITVIATFDALGRPLSKDYPGTSEDVTYVYEDPNVPNSVGQLTAVVSSVSGTHLTSFDQLGRVKSSKQVTDGQTFTFPDYSYDLSGNLVSQTYPSGRVVTTQTDDIGRLSRVMSSRLGQESKTYLSDLSYTAFGSVSRARLGNGRWESAVYDPQTLQLSEIALGASSSDKSLLRIEYGYRTQGSQISDNNGSLRRQKISYQGQVAPLVQEYGYDMLNRIQTAVESAGGVQSWKQTFLYDRYGNRRFDPVGTTTVATFDNITNPQADPATNRFLASDGYVFDAEGNLTANPENQVFTYNADNRITQSTYTVSGAVSNYGYDPAGQRVRKSASGVVTLFAYDAFGKLTAEYTSTPDATPTPAGQSVYVTSDALGSPRVATDGRGAVVARHDYMPFGEEVLAGTGGRASAWGYATASDPIQKDGVRKQFTGYERDGETGLDFAQNRYYASRHGRFTSVDPLAASARVGNPQTFNRYAYVLNSPYKFTDPLGLEPCGIQGTTSGSATGRTCNQSDDQEKFNRGLARYIFERASKGYIDTTAIMTATMFTGTESAVVATTVTLEFSISRTLLTSTRKFHTRTDTWGWDRGSWVKTNSVISEKVEKFEIGGSSGTGDCLNNPDCATDSAEYANKGPIPIGRWVLNKNAVTILNTGFKGTLRSVAAGVRSATGISVAPDYGSFRVPLSPGTNLLNRSGFYLHGGSFPGSAGCIDVGGGATGNDQTQALLSIIKSSNFDKIVLTVTW